MDTFNPMTAEADDHELLSRAINGDEEAFTSLVKRYQKSLYDFVWRQLENHADTADICQKTFLQVMLKAGEFRGDSSFRTWLFQIAINMCKNLYRSRDRQRIDDIEVEQHEDCNSLQQIEILQSQRILRDAIKLLPKQQKMTMELKIYRDFTFAEIAKTMRCSIGGAKANYSHALQAIKKYIQEHRNEG